LKKTSKLKALELSLKEKEKEYDDWEKNKDKKKEDEHQGPIAKASLDDPEIKKEDIVFDEKKKEDKSDDAGKEMEPGFKSFYDPTWTPKSDSENKDELEK